MHFPRRCRRLAGIGGGGKAQGVKAQGREVFVYSGVARQKWRIAQKSLAIMRGSWDNRKGYQEIAQGGEWGAVDGRGVV